ncbi:MAG: histidine--tRNA ligase [bacterium]|nr:histidine--tRNA ligase [bacterium]
MRPVKGTRDILPEDWYFRERVAEKLCKVLESYGYRRIETPVLEHFEVLARKAGEEIKEEIYYFKDKAGRELGLRFDMTVPVVRIVASRPDIPLPIRWYYYSRVWRYDEPQRGRYREFWQVGAELLGIPGLEADVELLDLILACFGALELEVKIYVNSREIVEQLLALLGLEQKKAELLRILDKKRKLAETEFEEEIKKICGEKANAVLEFANITAKLEKAIDVLQSLGLETQKLETLAELLKAAGIYNRIVFSADIVRGLDYYTGLCYEVYSDQFNLAIGGGGRYDNLVALYCGRHVPATGFALGFDRILSLLEQLGRAEKSVPKIDYWIYYTAPEYYGLAVQLARALRKQGYSCVVEITGRKLKAVLSRISSMARFLVILGKKEVEQGMFYVKNLETGEEKLEKLKDYI